MPRKKKLFIFPSDSKKRVQKENKQTNKQTNSELL
jgi:hypothetical protein